MLTIVTLPALPVDVPTGLYDIGIGIGIGAVPLAQHPHGFWIVVAIVASFTVIAA